MGGGAWPFLVDGVICLPNRDNLLTSHVASRDATVDFLEGLSASSRWKFEAITGL